MKKLPTKLSMARWVVLAALLGMARAGHAQDFVLTPNHAYELVFTATGETLLGAEFIGHFPGGNGYRIMSALFVESGNAIWRIPQIQDAKSDKERQYYIAKFECDTTGVLLAVVWDLLFPPEKKARP